MCRVLRLRHLLTAEQPPQPQAPRESATFLRIFAISQKPPPTAWARAVANVAVEFGKLRHHRRQALVGAADAAAFDLAEYPHLLQPGQSADFFALLAERTARATRDRAAAEAAGGAEGAGFEELLARADVLSLNLPLNVSVLHRCLGRK